MGNPVGRTVGGRPGKQVFPVSLEQCGKEEDSKPKTRVNTGPLRGNSQSHTDTAGSQREEGFYKGRIVKAFLTIAIQEEVHQDNKKGDVDINCGNPRLGKVHEIKGKKGTNQGGDGDVIRQLSGKEIAERNHDDSKQGSDNTPAEGIHAKQGDTNGNQNLPKGGMGIFISRKPQQKFIGGTGMINLIKVSSVPEAAADADRACRSRAG